MSFCIDSCSIDLHVFFLLLRLSAHALLISIALFAVCSCFVHIFELHLQQVHLFRVCSYANSFFLGISIFDSSSWL